MYLTLLLSFLLAPVVSPLVSSMLSMAALLMVTALFSTFMVSMIIGSWFAFILFLVYITGILVLFGYMLAMSSNTHTSKTYILAPIVFIALVCYPENVKLYQLSGSSNFEIVVTKLFEGFNMLMYWNMALILLAALIMVVSVCYNSPKPLRSFL